MALFTLGNPLKRLATALLSGLLLAATLTTPAHAADPSLTNVRIAWKDSTFQKVTVSWDEDSVDAAVVAVRNRGDATGPKMTFTAPAADQPNQLDLDADLLNAFQSSYFEPMEIGVFAGGGVAPAVSVPFDAFAPEAVQLVSSTLSAAGASTVRWKPGSRTDTTPGDPLDRTAPLTYQVTYAPLNGNTAYPIGGRTTVTQTTYTLRSEYRLEAVAYNEWGAGPVPNTLVTARATKLTVKIPAWAVYGQGNVSITGTYSPVLTGGNFRPIVLQARNSVTSPWYAVSTFTGNATGKFSFTLGSAGRRQYRVATAPIVTNGGASLHYGATTAAAWSSTQMWGLGEFSRFSIPVGQTNYAVLSAYPAVDTTAVLQRWSGTAWTVVGPVQVSSGRGTGAVKAAKPGRTTYRYYLPASTFHGLRVEAAYTPNFSFDTF